MNDDNGIYHVWKTISVHRIGYILIYWTIIKMDDINLKKYENSEFYIFIKNNDKDNQGIKIQEEIF